MGVEAHVGVGPRLQEHFHHVQVLRLLIVVRARLRIHRLGSPLGLKRGEEGRRSFGRSRKVRICTTLYQKHRQVELAVQRRHQKRAGIVGADLINVGPLVEEGERRLYVTLSSSVQECGHAARPADEHLPVREACHRWSPRIVGPDPAQRLWVDRSRIVAGQQKVTLRHDGRLSLRRADLPVPSLS